MVSQLTIKTRTITRLSANLFIQRGFSLVELMVGLVIGLLATLVIMQVFAVFEGQKRTTTGTSDAQTNGSVALYSMQRDVQLAGFGLPLYDRSNMPLTCTTVSPDTVRADGTAGADGIADVDHDGDLGAGTPNINMSPIDIIDGGNLPGATDTVIVRYGTTASGGVPVRVTDVAAAPALGVDTNMGCQNNDVVYAVTGSDCRATRVNDATLAANLTKITVLNAAGMLAGLIPTNLACLGAWNEYAFSVDLAANQLVRRVNAIDTPVVAGVVNIQAQYGISASRDSNQITQWVDASGVWAAPPVNAAKIVCGAASADRNCIKAIRVAVVSRNDLIEKQVVSTACSSTAAANPTGVCAWDATSADPQGVGWAAPVVDLSNTANWDRYRYRVYETIIPLRNIVWTKGRLA
jgi:type IV pilus assembly protein PilW